MNRRINNRINRWWFAGGSPVVFSDYSDGILRLITRNRLETVETLLKQQISSEQVEHQKKLRTSNSSACASRMV